MRRTHGWPATETHEPKPVVRFHGGDRSRVLPLPVVFALALGGCQDHVSSVDYDNEGSTTGVGLQGAALSPSDNSPLLVDPEPTCRFGYPDNFVDDYEYTGFVYRNPDRGHVLPGNKQIVDMKAHTPLGNEMWDIILWECQPAGLVVTISIEDSYGSAEDFSLEQIASLDGLPYYLTFRTGALPEPPPGPGDPIEDWERRFFFILTLRNPDRPDVLIRRASVTVRACDDALPPGDSECPSTPVGGQL